MLLPQKELSGGKPKVSFVSFDKVRITHSQSIKQSLNYQAMEANYGIEITVGTTREEIEAGAAYCENTVQKLLQAKAAEHSKHLIKLAGNH